MRRSKQIEESLGEDVTFMTGSSMLQKSCNCNSVLNFITKFSSWTYKYVIQCSIRIFSFHNNLNGEKS